MKQKVLTRISLLLALILLFGVFPMTASAADNELVLTSINHTAAVSAVDVRNTSVVTLLVPFNFSGSVDLSNGLDIVYDTNVYAYAVASFPEGAIVDANGHYTSMLVAYKRKDSVVVYSANYRICVERAPNTTPDFSGAILKKAAYPGTINFTSADFASKYTRNSGEPLAAIAITGSNPSFGTLKYNTSAYVPGGAITVSDLDAGKLTFSATGAGTVSYIVKAYQSGNLTTPIGSVTLTITVEAPAAVDMKAAFSTLKNVPVALNDTKFKNAYSEAAKDTLSYVKFSLPAKMHGKLYYNYRSPSSYDGILSSDTAYSVTLLPFITFVPDTEYVGTVTIPFTGFSQTDSGFTGKLLITVSDLHADAINYTAPKDTPVSFNPEDFNDICEELTGKSLSYVRFTSPQATYGKLYYNYKSANEYEALVPSGASLYLSSSPCLSMVDFVPASGFTGTVTIPYTGYTTEGAAFQGQIKITVKAADNDWDDWDDWKYWSKAKRNSSISKGKYISLLCKVFDLDEEDFLKHADDEAYGGKKDSKSSRDKHLCKKKDWILDRNLRSSLSRQDALVLLADALEASGIDLPEGSNSGLKSFSDHKKIAKYAVDEVSALIKAEIVEINCKKLRPKSSISYGEVAVLINRAKSKF